MASQVETLTEKMKALDALVSRAVLLTHDGDRAPYIVTGQVQFDQGSTGAADIVFTVPSEADMYAKGLNLWLGFKSNDTVAPLTTSDRTFRPTDWAFTGASAGGYASTIGLRDADASIQMRDSSGPLHPGSIAVAFTFSQRYGTPNSVTISNDYQIPQTSWFGRLEFDCDYYVKRGTTMAVSVSTLNFGPAISGTRRDKLRVFGVLEGFKKVKAFK